MSDQISRRIVITMQFVMKGHVELLTSCLEVHALDFQLIYPLSRS